MTTTQDAWNRIAERAWTDETYKQELLDNPNKVLKAAGVPIPAGVSFVVVENEPDRLHLVLPSKPGAQLDVAAADNAALSAYNAAVGF